MNFQHILRQRRMELGLTMTELSRMSGISRTYISELESGKATDPSVAVVNSLAAALGVSLAAMLEEDDDTDVPDYPASLREAADKYQIPEEDLPDLARVKFRNYQPVSAEDWKFLYDAIRRSVPQEAGEKE